MKRNPFEFTKHKVNADIKTVSITDIVEKLAKDYHLSITVTPTGELEVFVGTARKKEVNNAENTQNVYNV